MASSKVLVSLKNCFEGHCSSFMSFSLALLIGSKPKKSTYAGVPEWRQ
jgi:hypothetical protein